jgi:hypothetical protein
MDRTLTDIERRAAKRWTPRDLPWPIACRITPGRVVVIIDISAAGMLVESPTPLFPGRPVTLQLTRASQQTALQGAIVRGSLAALDRERGPTFRSGIAFDEAFEPLRDSREDVTT